MPISRFNAVLALLLVFTIAPLARAQQQKPPHVGYVYPAGGKIGKTATVIVGGQFLDEDGSVRITGCGVHAKVVSCVKPLSQKQISELREKADELRKKPKDAVIAKELIEIGRKLAAARNLMNPGISEKAMVEIKIDADAELGMRELRFETGNGLSNPLVFEVGPYNEFEEIEKPGEEQPLGPPAPKKKEPAAKSDDAEIKVTLPCTLNGQIMPGDVDRFRFHARKGQRIVAEVSARELIPYLADAVPGWFQAAAAIYDSNGNELAYDDHFRFRPDPVLSCKIPHDGVYVLEIRDSLYRGREDFVYRVALGELPYVTSIYPLGGPADKQTEVELKGWNLSQNKLTMDGRDIAQKTPEFSGNGISAILPLEIKKGLLRSNLVPFAVDSLAECLEKEPNNKLDEAQKIEWPMIVNGRIDSPGDKDVFRIEGRKGEKIVADVDARRLDSPLDSLLELSDAEGRRIAMNDDFADKSDGLRTHHADSFLLVELPKDGAYYITLKDSQNKGGPEYGCRLRIDRPRPDFALRVVPSSVNIRAGSSTPIIVYALRKEGFAGEIELSLKDESKTFKLSGGNRIAADNDQLKLTITAPQTPSEEPRSLEVFGKAKIDGKEVAHFAVPAEDMMQAFIYHHLVPSKNLLAEATQRIPPRLQLKYLGQSPVKLALGETAKLQFSGPRGQPADRIVMVLKDPPDGIAVENVTLEADKLSLEIHADPEKAKAGQKGNLVVDVFVERAPNAEKGKPALKKRRFPMGTLPAIPFETVEPSR
jgi:hypothetical protein